MKQRTYRAAILFSCKVLMQPGLLRELQNFRTFKTPDCEKKNHTYKLRAVFNQITCLGHDFH